MNRNLRNAIIIGAILLGLLIVGSIWGGFVGFGNGGMMGGLGGLGVGMFGIGVIFMVVFWVLVIWGIVSLIRWLSYSSGAGAGPMHPMHHGGSSASALQILHERYARGEINKEEYEQKKKDLGG